VLDRTSVDWEGIFVGLVTPFDKDGALDDRAFAEVVELAITEGVDGLLVTGDTGEWWTLTDVERTRLYKVAVSQARGRVPVVAGTASISTSTVIDLMRAAKDFGCEGALVPPPPYGLPKEKEIIHHYGRIAQAIDFPIMLYNNPRRVGRSLTPNLIATLADVPSVVAIKDSQSDPDAQEELLLACRDKIRYFGGPAYLLNRFVPLGSSGTVQSYVGQLSAADEAGFYWAVKRGETQRIEASLQRPVMSPRLNHLMWEEAGMFPATLKEAMNLLGRPGGYPREPLLPLAGAERDHLRLGLENLGFQLNLGLAQGSR
jgi:4-hydroxy-tetrahydrodipicolinate synthase